jgi:hypothetical protein
MISVRTLKIIAMAVVVIFAACGSNKQKAAMPGDTAVKATVVPVNQTPTVRQIKIAVNEAKGSITITVNNKPVELEGLALALTQLLVLQEDIQSEIPVEYNGEVLMGMRSEISSEVNTGIKNAKEIKYKIYADAVIPFVAKEVKVPVALDVLFFRQQGNNAFLSAIMMDPNGYELELNKTPHAKEAEGGSYSTSVFALLNYKKGNWVVTTVSVGATDVPMICWWKEFNVPKTLFPEDLAASDCQ